jgi:hypothetical protein
MKKDTVSFYATAYARSLSGYAGGDSLHEYGGGLSCCVWFITGSTCIYNTLF